MKQTKEKVFGVMRWCILLLLFSSKMNAQCTGYFAYITEQDACIVNDITLTAYDSLTSSSASRTYLWSSGETTKTISGKTSGSFWVRVATSTGCIDTAYITVVDDTCNPCSNFNGYIYQIDSCGANDLSIYTITSGGSGNYSYNWSHGATTASIFNRASGTYTVTVTDNTLGCTKVLNINAIDSTCNNCTTTISENDGCVLNDIALTANPRVISGASYLWSSGETTRTVSNKAPGSYWVKVTNAGCIDTAYFTAMDDTCNPCANFYLYIGQSDSCGRNNVNLISYVGGGSGNYSYQWSTGDSSSTISGRTTGLHSLTVTDISNGCTKTYSIMANDTICDSCDYIQANILEIDSCRLNDIQLIANGFSNNNVSYLWSTGATTKTISNRASGSYWVRISHNGTNCSDTAYITVSDDTCNPCSNFSMAINEYSDSCGISDVLIGANVIGGSLSYSYLWNTGDTSQFLYNRTSGFYSVSVTDKIKGCIRIDSFTIQDDTCSPCSNFSAYTYYLDSCLTNDIALHTSVWGGSGNYSYIWNTGSTAAHIYNKSTGSYTVIVTDVVHGCKDTLTIYAVDSNHRCCSASFYAMDPNVGSTKNLFGLGNSQLSSSITYQWSFGDGTAASGQNTTKTYSTTGNKTVCLYIQDGANCKDTFCDVVNVPIVGKNLRVSHYGWSPFVRDTGRLVTILYSNVGNTTESGTIEYKFPVGMTFVSSSPSPTSISGNLLTYNVGSLAPGAHGNIYLTMRTPSSFALGSMKCDTAIILPVIGDVESFNNYSYVCDSVVASYDPNDKIPSPKGVGSDGEIDPATKEISYIVRFQNQGNWRTYRIRVEDQIDPSFDISSLMIGEASHPFRLVKHDQKLIWYFDNIELTPKSVNIEKSQGYISYTLKLKSGLTEGTQIKNTAHIYFDNNPAIITNTAKNTLKSASGSSSIRNQNLSEFDFNVSNINGGIRINTPKKMTGVKIFDLTGKLIYTQEFKSKIEDLEVLTETSIYIIQVEFGETQVVKKYQK